jgi:hypothetical protein
MSMPTLTTWKASSTAHPSGSVVASAVAWPRSPSSAARLTRARQAFSRSPIEMPYVILRRAPPRAAAAPARSQISDAGGEASAPPHVDAQTGDAHSSAVRATHGRHASPCASRSPGAGTPTPPSPRAPTRRIAYAQARSVREAALSRAVRGRWIALNPLRDLGPTRSCEEDQPVGPVLPLLLFVALFGFTLGASVSAVYISAPLCP